MKKMKKSVILLVFLVLIGLVAINFYVGQIYENNDSGQILQESSSPFLTLVDLGLHDGVLGTSTFENCWVNTDNATCVGVSGCQWKTVDEDPYCNQGTGCCMDIGCWDYDGTNQSACDTNNGAMNCTWDPYMSHYYPNGTQAPVGGCMEDFSSGGGDWGGSNSPSRRLPGRDVYRLSWRS